jgi:WS/DGAT/MGAT family acyltransferase
LDRIPRYRQKVVTLPLNLDEPIWVDDDEFDLKFHVRRAALPSPGGDHELCKFVERVYSKPLDRRRPLWELYYVEGLADHRWAIVTKTHHCVVDGLAVMELATLLLDSSPDYHPPGRPSSWRANRNPGTLDVLLETARERIGEPARVLKTAASALAHPLATVETLVESSSGLAAIFQEIEIGSSPINGETGPTRAYGYSRFSLEEFKRVKHAFHATINDVALGVVSGGIRRYLADQGADVDSLHLKALVPISQREESPETPSGNELSMMVVPLAVDERSAKVRMRRAKQHVEATKRSHQAAGADLLRRVASSMPGPLHPVLAKGMGLLAGYNTIVTNIPGPQLPLFCLGGQMVEAMPIAFIYEGQQVAVGILSYNGAINFGYVSDGVALPDVDRLGRCMEEAFRELSSSARQVAAA